MDYTGLREEALKNAVRDDFFGNYRYTQLGNIDFVIARHNTDNGSLSLFEDTDGSPLKSLLWAEAKQGTKHDIYGSFVQLILTIGKEKTHEKYIPPKYIGAFDAEKIALIEYSRIQGVFYQNDFNWNAAPSDHGTNEFRQLYGMCRGILEETSIVFHYSGQADDLRKFIGLNFRTTRESSAKIAVTKNNFTFVFGKWEKKVKPSINVDWRLMERAGVISANFFLADLLSADNESLKDSLYVVLRKTKYELAKKIDELGLQSFSSAGFKDRQKAYREFWNVYERPPRKEYWDYIVARRDLLVPQDIRERKGSFFTPRIWVEKSQEYLADVLGENWQEEYYIWDCCAGTGNLLNGLANYRNVWASTLDKADADVMKDRVENGWGMFENHIFQFDFLNDDFSKCPEELLEIIMDGSRRKKLLIYINPPYAEAGRSKNGKYKAGVSVSNKTYEKYKAVLGRAGNEIFAQLLTRVCEEIPGCKIGSFSTLKVISGPNSVNFRSIFTAELEKLFIVPAKTFDNVKGEFPIGFFIWSLEDRASPELALPGGSNSAVADVFDSDGKFISRKKFYKYNAGDRLINDWLRLYFDKKSMPVGIMHNNKNDFQTCQQVFITSEDSHDHTTPVTESNLTEMCIYHAVRHCVEHTWINHNDQFFFPRDSWKSDYEFQSDCLVYTLFHDKNRISCAQGVNHWIPFTERQCGCRNSFKSGFMAEYLAEAMKKRPLSEAAKSVYDAGLELWRYYHSFKNSAPDASLYDIRRYFQGESNGKMRASSDDVKYTGIITLLRAREKALGGRIAEKTYMHGFLK